MNQEGYAITVTQREGRWEVREFADNFTRVSHAISAVRNLRSESAAFAIVNVEEEYLAIVRPGPRGTRALISDATMAVDDDFAADICEEAGIEIPDIDPADLDDVDAYADGDFDILADLGLSEGTLAVLIDDGEADPSEIIERIADELGFLDELLDAVG
ncbi:tRNA adenosine deaminase-associated protein [Corynebacterium aquatimens]|uniref:tRNA adenosine deaminase-associated protein n=1 Tax=Corynebacterium aquatimens TaxID=1190508 RepID=A0A931E3P4_9CORY|nr:tRNA adenosine deaminase-associated protein [Corynebacterium aquatimens]MBG6122576.1 putative tRNA adenosine deaminase-associated protein [Corynebacterium aquatimens]WJY64884.1 hypothetical protein CAQUA_00700 [Corynebacterium aquatimens]